MEERLPCDKHSEQIRNLYEKDVLTNKKFDEKDLLTNKRIDGMGNLQEVIHNLDKNMALQTQMMAHMVERNDRQDRRMDDQDNIMVKVNENLTELAEGQKFLNQGHKVLGIEVKTLKDKVDQNESKHMTDNRDIEKERSTNKLKQVLIPASIGGAVVTAIGAIIIALIQIL